MNPTNELKPLLSRRQVHGHIEEDGSTNCTLPMTPSEICAAYEADRAKTHALVQQLVDALEATKHKPDWWRHHPSEEWIYDVIADAAEQGFKPFQP